MNERLGASPAGVGSGPGGAPDPPRRWLSAPWWEVAGRAALAGSLGLPGLAFLTAQLLNLNVGRASLRSALPTLAVACGLLAVAALAACGRTRFAAVLLAAYAVTLAVRLVGVNPPGQGAALLLHLGASILGLGWIAGRHAAVRRRSLVPVRAAALGLSTVCLLAAPYAAAEIGALLGAAIEPPPRIVTRAAGERVPDLRLSTLAGEALTLREPGVVYVVNFWATWCAPCLLELPELAAAARRAADDPTVRFLAVNAEGLAPDRIRAFLAARDLADLPACLDPEGAGDALGVRSLPVTLLVKDGRLVRRFEGYRPGIGDEIAAEIAGVRVRGEAPPPTAR